MSTKARWFIVFTASGLFLLLDQFLKSQAINAWTAPKYLFSFFGWYPYFNPGIGFGLPVPQGFIIILTIIILALIAYHLYKQIKSDGQTKSFIIQYSLFSILTGAVSNLIDRLTYHHTVDYIFAFTGYINLADILIVAGFVVYLVNKNSACHSERNEVK
ncbi:MAG: signal peptidase II [Patescibacteria group bacterium]